MGKTNQYVLNQDEKLAENSENTATCAKGATQVIKKKYASIVHWAKIGKTLKRQPGSATGDWGVFPNKYSRKNEIERQPACLQ